MNLKAIHKALTGGRKNPGLTSRQQTIVNAATAVVKNKKKPKFRKRGPTSNGIGVGY